MGSRYQQSMQVKSEIYLDSNAGAPIRPCVSAALQDFFSVKDGLIGNPSSIHSVGRRSKKKLGEAREKVARSLGKKTDPEQIIFTSSGTEANQLAIRSVLGSILRSSSSHNANHSANSRHWITTPVEHDSIIQMASWFRNQGGSVGLLSLNSRGSPTADELESLWQPGRTALVSVILVNNETGVITGLAPIAKIVKARGGLLHVDASQAWGKMSLDVSSLGADLVTVSAHKIGALAGTGALWVRPGIPVSAVICGNQEKGRRGGTENLVGVVAMGAAAEQLGEDAYIKDWSERVGCLRDRLESSICNRISGTTINGKSNDSQNRVANTSNFSFDGVEGDSLVMAMDLAGYCVSSGSACSSGKLEPSHVLMAMGRTKLQAMAALRVSLFDEIPWELLEGFVEALEQAVTRIRA